MSEVEKYNHLETEKKWYTYWMENKMFASSPDEREPYTICIPPPNVTGILHMGHMLNNTIQDVLIRRARMMGKNACWVPGTDHASIATEAKVVAKLAAEGISKDSLTREEFLKHAWEWTHKHGGIILDQLKRIGASADWDRTAFTMDEKLSDSVIKVFVELYNKGLIYRGVRMVNWDPSALTALSDEEVLYKEEDSRLFYLKYFIEGTNEYLIVATTRPETIFGDTAVCINPQDERYAKFIGKKVIVPIVNRAINIIVDDYVDKDFGTGVLKVTPAHDINDYLLGDKHRLEIIDIFNPNGTLNENGLHYKDKDRFLVKKLIAKELEEKNLLEKIENYKNKVGVSERTGAVIEPKLSMQWFLKMEKLAKPALDVVVNGEVKLYPPKFVNTYKHWMENIKDWCISRQLWWGHQIPAYYLPNGEIVVETSLEKAFQIVKDKHGDKYKKEDLKQDADALDTWFSSWLWPMSVFDGVCNPENKDYKYYYPTNDLVTGPDILFFWVARMIVAGIEFNGKVPFKNVYLTGIVRDDKRRKMSKSLGNSPDLLNLLDTYSADGVRMAMLLCSAAGNDLLYDEKLALQGRNFGNKLWNSYILTTMWRVESSIPENQVEKDALLWINNLLLKTVETVNTSFEQYRISEALMAIYKFVWDDFSASFLELVKPKFISAEEGSEPISETTYKGIVAVFNEVLKLLHPFMPFMTEELYNKLNTTKENDGKVNSIMTQSWIRETSHNSIIIADFEYVREFATTVRNVRATNGLSPRIAFEIELKKENPTLKKYFGVAAKLSNITACKSVTEFSKEGFSVMVKTDEFFIPYEMIGSESQKEKLEEELKYYEGFLASIEKKLSNEGFVSKAPAKVLEIENKKKADCISKIETLKRHLM